MTNTIKTDLSVFAQLSKEADRISTKEENRLAEQATERLSEQLRELPVGVVIRVLMATVRAVTVVVIQAAQHEA